MPSKINAQSPGLSIDWRYLLDISDKSKILVIGQRCEEIGKIFNILGASSITCCRDIMSLPFVRQTRTDISLHIENACDDLQFDSEYLSFYNVIALPFGLPRLNDKISENRDARLLHCLKRALHPKGNIMVGFFNELRFWEKPKFEFRSLPRQITSMLIRAGYDTVRVYGVIPYQDIPVYIFPLNERVIDFVLSRRYGSKLPLGLLRILGKLPVSLVLFPWYFAIADPSQ